MGNQQHGPGPAVVSVEVDLPPDLAPLVYEVADREHGGMVADAIVGILRAALTLGAAAAFALGMAT